MTRKGEDRASPRRVAAAERRAQALELRKAGATYDQIATQLGYSSKGHAHGAVQQALRDITTEPAEELRTLELQRLDAMLIAIWPQVRKGNQGAIDRALRIQDRRSKYLGLDAPAKSEVSGPAGDPISMQVADFAALPAKVRRERLTELAAEVTRRATANTTKNDDD